MSKLSLFFFYFVLFYFVFRYIFWFSFYISFFGFRVDDGLQRLKHCKLALLECVYIFWSRRVLPCLSGELDDLRDERNSEEEEEEREETEKEKGKEKRRRPSERAIDDRIGEVVSFSQAFLDASSEPSSTKDDNIPAEFQRLFDIASLLSEAKEKLDREGAADTTPVEFVVTLFEV